MCTFPPAVKLFLRMLRCMRGDSQPLLSAAQDPAPRSAGLPGSLFWSQCSWVGLPGKPWLFPGKERQNTNLSPYPGLSPAGLSSPAFWGGSNLKA